MRRGGALGGVGLQLRRVYRGLGFFDGAHHGAVDLDAHLQQHGDGIALDAFDHLVEHLIAFLLIGDDGVYVAVGAQADTLAQLIHGVDLVDPVAVYVHQQEAALDVGIVDAEVRLDFGDLLLVRLFGRLGDLFDRLVHLPAVELFLGDEVHPLGQQAVVEGAVEGAHVPLFGHFVDVDRLGDDLMHEVGDVFDHLVVYVFALQYLHALGVDDLALLVHHVVVLQDVLADAEVAALDGALRVFDAVREHLRLQAGVFVGIEGVVDLFHPFAAEALDEVVFEGDEEHGNAGVSLAAAAAAQLVVDTARFVPLGAEDAKAARLDDLFLLFIRFRLIFVVQRVVHGAVLLALLLLFALQFGVRGSELDHVVLHALFAHALFGQVFGVAAQKDVGAAARHVGGDGHRPQPARLGNDLRLALVVFGVEDVVLDAVFAQHAGDLFRLFHRGRTDEDGLAACVARLDLFEQGALFAVCGGIHGVGHILADDGLVGGDL